jgi:hypothetical protein
MTEGTQRRLAAIDSADVVGYSRLTGELCPNLVFEHLKESGVSG